MTGVGNLNFSHHSVLLGSCRYWFMDCLLIIIHIFYDFVFFILLATIFRTDPRAFDYRNKKFTEIQQSVEKIQFYSLILGKKKKVIIITSNYSDSSLRLAIIIGSGGAGGIFHLARVYILLSIKNTQHV